jgi:hypothetical protein
MTPDDLEALVHRELKELDWPRAPQTLRPRVLAGARRRQNRPWYMRPWPVWPVACRAVAAACAVAAFAGLWMAVRWAGAAAGPVLRDLAGGVAGRVEAWARVVSAGLTVGETIWRAVMEPVAVYLTAVVLVMAVAGAACGAAIARAVPGRELSS